MLRKVKSITVLVVALLFSTAIMNTKTVSIKPINYSKEDILWMARNVYYEARNQSAKGMIAVMYTTLNRTLSEQYPQTIKDVVTQRNKKGCQFSWYCTKNAPVNEQEFLKIYNFVKQVLPVLYIMNDPTHGALYYHANYVKPAWAKVFTKTAVIDDHIFYKGL